MKGENPALTVPTKSSAVQKLQCVLLEASIPVKEKRQNDAKTVFFFPHDIVILEGIAQNWI